MRFLAMLRKTTIELLKDRLVITFGLLFPVMLILVFGAAFGAFTGGDVTYEIAIINLDQGYEDGNVTHFHGAELARVLTDAKYSGKGGANGTVRVFNVRDDLTEEQARSLVQDQHLTAYIVIPQNFSRAVRAESIRQIRSAVTAGAQDWLTAQGELNYSDPALVATIVEGLFSNLTAEGFDLYAQVPQAVTDSATVMVIGDPGKASFYAASSIVDSISRRYVDSVGEAYLLMSSRFLPFPIEPGSTLPFVSVASSGTSDERMSEFDYYVPGVMVFGLLISSITVTIYLSREESRGTLTRLKLTKMRSVDMLLGTIIPYTVFALVQMAVLVAVAIGIGYEWREGTDPFLVAALSLLGCLASVSLGLILASFVKNEEQAGTLSAAIVIPITFLVGAWLPLPTIRITNNFLWMGRAFDLFDWLPWTQCYKGLAKAMTLGAGWGDVAFEIIATTVFTLLLFSAGVISYHGSRLRSSE